MDHNEFHFINDLVKPFKEFIKRLDFQGTDSSNSGSHNVSTQQEGDNSDQIITKFSEIDESCVDYI